MGSKATIRVLTVEFDLVGEVGSKEGHNKSFDSIVN